MGVVTEIGRYTVINERFVERIAANWKNDFTMLLMEEGN